MTRHQPPALSSPPQSRPLLPARPGLPPSETLGPQRRPGLWPGPMRARPCVLGLCLSCLPVGRSSVCLSRRWSALCGLVVVLNPLSTRSVLGEGRRGEAPDTLVGSRPLGHEGWAGLGACGRSEGLSAALRPRDRAGLAGTASPGGAAAPSLSCGLSVARDAGAGASVVVLVVRLHQHRPILLPCCDTVLPGRGACCHTNTNRTCPVARPAGHPEDPAGVFQGERRQMLFPMSIGLHLVFTLL